MSARGSAELAADAADIGLRHGTSASVHELDILDTASFAAFFVGKEAGIFAKHGLDVTVRTGPSGSGLVPLLESAGRSASPCSRCRSAALC
jgi:ABC-type nitrate/sulfonate/bicarbonate transport system substrate-binding protein